MVGAAEYCTGDALHRGKVIVHAVLLGHLRFERRLYPAAEMNFVLLDAAADDLLRLLAAECVRGRGVLVFERLVDLEKVRNFAGAVRRNLAYVLVKVPGRILKGNGR